MRFGHVADDPDFVAADLATRHVTALVGVRFSPAQNVDHSAHLDGIQDQAATNSCVGFALSTSLYMRGQLSGAPIARPSALAIYAFARMLSAPYAALTDDGSQPRMAMRGLTEYGIVAQDRWPLDSVQVNEPPPLDVFQHGAGSLVTDYYRIASGLGASAMIRVALAKGYIPVLAVTVDQAFVDLGSGVYDGPKGPSLGSHMMAVIGSGDGWLRLVNSWGTSWSDGGFGRVSDLFIDRYARDVLVPTVVPSGAS
jgi:hypothetical protein